MLRQLRTKIQLYRDAAAKSAQLHLPIGQFFRGILPPSACLLAWGPHAEKARSAPPRSTEIDEEKGALHGIDIELLRAKLYCHVQKIRVIHEARTVRHTDRRRGQC